MAGGTGQSLTTAVPQALGGAALGTAAGLGYNPMQVQAAQAGQIFPIQAQQVQAAQTGQISPIQAQQIQAAQTGQVGPISAQNVYAGQLAATNLNPYMNPYTEQVVRANEADILRGAQIGLNQLGAQAQAARAFGGSRQAVTESELGRNVAQQLAQSSAGLRQAGFTQAQQAAQQDIQSRMQAALANQQAGLSAGTTSAQLQQQANLANQQAAMQAALANQQAGLTAGTTSAQFQQQANLANQQAAMQAALSNQQAGLSAGTTSAQLQQQTNLANQQAAMQAALANQQAGLSGAQFRLGAAQQLGNLANLGFGIGQQVQQNLSSQGAMQQGLQQALIDAARAQYAGYVGAPSQALSTQLGAFSGSQTGQQTTTGTQSYRPGLFDYLSLGASIIPKFPSPSGK